MMADRRAFGFDALVAALGTVLLMGCSRAKCDDWCDAQADAWDTCRATLEEARFTFDCYEDPNAVRENGPEGAARHACADGAELIMSCDARVDYWEATGLAGDELEGECLPEDASLETSVRARDCDAIVDALQAQLPDP